MLQETNLQHSEGGAFFWLILFLALNIWYQNKEIAYFLPANCEVPDWLLMTGKCLIIGNGSMAVQWVKKDETGKPIMGFFI